MGLVRLSKRLFYGHEKRSNGRTVGKAVRRIALKCPKGETGGENADESAHRRKKQFIGRGVQKALRSGL